MLKIFSVAAATMVATVAVAASAETADAGSFKHEGYTYVYQVKQVGEGQLISGHRYPGGAAFSLRVNEGEVSGTSNGVPVHFGVADAAGASTGAKPTKLSMR